MGDLGRSKLALLEHVRLVLAKLAQPRVHTLHLLALAAELVGRDDLAHQERGDKSGCGAERASVANNDGEPG